MKIISSRFFYVNYLWYISSILMEVTTSLTKNKIMTVEQRLSNLEASYLKWSEKENGFGYDAGYVWWEREKDCQEWCNKEKTYVPMSATKTLVTMRAWVKRQKSFS